MIACQADMWDPEKGIEHRAGYEPFAARVAQHTESFGRPVPMLHGDSHVYPSDDPLSASDPVSYMRPGYDVPNGSDAFGPFRWERVTQ